MSRPHRARLRWIVVVIVLSAMTSACTGGDEAETGTTDAVTMVAQDLEADTFVVNVKLTDEGFEPSRILIPAGNHVRLVLRNHGDHEHHYRVAGLIVSDLAWYQEADFSEDEIASMTPEELEAIGVTGDIDDAEHVSHHLAPTWVPYKEPSFSGIKPIGNEVHGYAQRGQIDVLSFYPLSVGSFVVEDVRYPEITGEVVVFQR